MLRIAIDLHGVLVNFENAAKAALGIPKNANRHLWDFYRGYYTEQEFIEKIHEFPRSFWENLPFHSRKPYRLIETVKQFDRRPTVLSHSINTKSDVGGTNLIKNTFGINRIILVRESGFKARYAADFDVLIDDSVTNVREFCEAGGIGILWGTEYNMDCGDLIRVEDTVHLYYVLQGVQQVIGNEAYEGEGYRLRLHSEQIADGDEFWSNGQWSRIPAGLVGVDVSFMMDNGTEIRTAELDNTEVLHNHEVVQQLLDDDWDEDVVVSLTDAGRRMNYTATGEPVDVVLWDEKPSVSYEPDEVEVVGEDRRVSVDEFMYQPATEEVRVTNEETGGEKCAKPIRMDLIPTDALAEFGRVYHFGSLKYPAHNFRKGYDFSLSLAALFRHLNAWNGGEDNDPESGLSHLMHVAWHCFTLLQNQFDHGDRFDDRYRPSEEVGRDQEGEA